MPLFSMWGERITSARWWLPLLLCLGVQSGDCLATNDTARSVVGAWRLVSYTDTVAGEKPIQAFGANPIGLFVFTADGHVSVSIMRNPPDISSPTTDPDPDACIPVWFCSYFGTYKVNYQTATWVIHVDGSNVPTFLGTNQTRHFSIHGDRLVIADSYEEHGKTVRVERILVRSSP
jgi:hypothetical protein